MEISSYLAELIRTRKEVSVSGLGTFFKKKSPGRYDVKSHSFLPPTYTLDFTTEVKEDTGLAAYIAAKKNISTDSATYYVEQFSEHVRNQLSEQEHAVLPDLGSLTISSGLVVFKADEAAKIGFSSYGLPSFKDKSQEPVHPSTLIETPESEESEEITTPETYPLHVSLGSEEISEVISGQEVIVPDPPAPVQNYTTPETYPLPESPEVYETKSGTNFTPYLVIAAVILALVGIVYLVKPDLFKNSDQGNQTTSASSVQNKPVPTAQQRDSTTTQDSAAKVIVPADTLNNTTTVIAPPVDTVMSYEIIAASLLNKKEADNFLQQMKKRGIPAKVAKLPGRRIKISIGTYIDEITAKNELQRLKETTKIPGIYIYPIKHTHKP